MSRYLALATCLAALLLAPAAARGQEAAVRVGVYAGPGTDAGDRAKLAEALKAPGLTVSEVQDVSGLSGVDVLVVGGGSGTKLARGLGRAGGKAVAAFVEQGGGYVGLGAGAYLGARGYNTATRVLELVDARVVAPRQWKRGAGQVRLAPLDASLPATGWMFQNGPMFAPARGHQQRTYEPLARFASDPESPVKVVAGADAIVRASYGKGRAVLFSVLAHQAAGTSKALVAAVRWAHASGQVGAAAPVAPAGAIRVAVLDDLGCIDGCVVRTFVCLDAAKRRFFVRRVSGREVAGGALSFYDVVVLPGGSATKQSRALGTEGRKRIQAFVAKGGGYVGTCAGAYLAAAEPKRYGLGLAAVRCVDTKHWKRGEGIVELETTPDLAKITGAEGATLRMLYANGPLLEPLAVDGLPAVTVLARFRSDMAKNGAPSGMMPGKLAALCAEHHKGRVVVFSVHPELTKGCEGMLRRAVAWAARAAAQ